MWDKSESQIGVMNFKKPIKPSKVASFVNSRLVSIMLFTKLDEVDVAGFSRQLKINSSIVRTLRFSSGDHWFEFLQNQVLLLHSFQFPNWSKIQSLQFASQRMEIQNERVFLKKVSVASGLY